MKILFINSVCGTGSTGRICTDLALQMEAQGHEVKIAYGRHQHVPDRYERFAVRIGDRVSLMSHVLRSRLLDQHGFGSKLATKRFLRWVEAYEPDLIWLHNIHGYYINVQMLFDWLKQHPDIQVKWTLHDCWTFTGHCAYFTMAGCDQWQQGCQNCPQRKTYPASYGPDRSAVNFATKKKAFNGVKNMRIITPSQWLADLVKKSFLAEYPVEVCYNKIDTAVFKPTPSDFRERYGLQNKKIVLGVASVWEPRKGLPDFLKLSRMVDGDTAIILVGLKEDQSKDLPGNILAIPRTNSPAELAQIYTAADVFFNPTYENNFPTVNLEAQACGTRVVTYDTGGSKETLYTDDSSTVKTGDLEGALALLFGE